MQQIVVKKILISYALVFFAVGFLSFLTTSKAQAAGLANVTVRLDRMMAGQTTGGTICARPTTTDTETLVKVTFPTGFTVNTTAANWTTSVTNLPANPAGYTVSAWPGIGAAASSVSGQDVTFASTDLTPGTTIYCFNFAATNTLTTGSVSSAYVGAVTTQKAGPTTIDSSSYNLATITDDTITITAVVPPNFTFSIAGGNTDTFSGNLSSASVVSTAGKTATITTNAANGWVAWVKSANAGLNSATAATNIATAGTLDNTPTDLAATTGYVLDTSFTDSATAGTGTVSQATGYGAEYAGNGTTSGGTLSTTFQPIAAANGVTDGDTITLKERVKISAIQKAANDYTDTLTVIAAGRF